MGRPCSVCNHDKIEEITEAIEELTSNEPKVCPACGKEFDSIHARSVHLHHCEEPIPEGIYTQRQLARKFGIPESTMGQHIRNGHQPVASEKGEKEEDVWARIHQTVLENGNAISKTHNGEIYQPRVDSPPGKGWVTTRQAGWMLGISRRAVSRKVKRGELDGIKYNGQYWLHRDHVNAFDPEQNTEQHPPGVYLDKQSGKWRAKIDVHVGYYDTQAKAVKARKEALDAIRNLMSKIE